MATTSNRWLVVCQDPGYGSGDLVVELSSDLLEALGWALGDELTIKEDQDCISLELKRKVGQIVP
nr:AbrB/MazE/SpoVT family DNA-binding domain-containing protein [Stutzerimonas stutzeri]